MRRLLVPLLLVSLLAGCTQIGSSPEIRKLEPNVNVARVELYNRFGFDLFGKLSADENRLISPISIALALAMAYNGADGSTKEEMADMLHCGGLDPDGFNQENQALLRLLQDTDVTLNIANSIWLRAGLPVKTGFIDNNKEFYDAQVSELDFNNPSSVDTINGWVKENTNGLIEEIISSPIDPLTLMFLINAVYFQGDWSRDFDESQTRDDLFVTSNGTVTVPFMQQGGSFSYLEDKDLQAIRLPYGAGRLAMYIFLPKDLSEFEQQLRYENWKKWVAGFKQSNGHLSLPKFQMEYETELNAALKALGMRLAFDPEQADFSQMVAGDTYIDNVKHKTFLKVDETGTEAAAVTAVEISCTGMPASTFEMKVNRPFFFAIHDSEADTILFMGSVLDPR